MTDNNPPPGEPPAPLTQPPLREILAHGATTGRRRRRRRLLWGSVGVVLFTAAASALFSGDEEGAVTYRTLPAQRGDLVVTISATGTLEPTDQVDVGIEVSGTIRTVAVDDNDRVTVGQVLAELDTSKLTAQLLQSQAALKVAQARLQQARATLRNASSDLDRLQRAHALSGGKVPSRREMDAAEAALETARADVASARAEIDQRAATVNANQTDLRKAVVHSPIDGIVLKRAVDPGQTVAATFQTPTLFTLAQDLTRMALHVDVDEADVGQVRAGQDATFTVDAYPNRVFPARVEQVNYGAQTVAGVVTYETIMTVDNGELLLRPGMTATADIRVLHLSDALLIPDAALRFAPPKTEQAAARSSGSLFGRLFFRRNRSAKKARPEPPTHGDSATVWTLQDGKPRPLTVQIGASDGIHTAITGGDLAPGTALIVGRLAPAP